MFQPLTLLDVASGMARHAALRHRVLAENVANADTPGYRARDVADFGTIVNESFTAQGTKSSRAGPRVFEIDQTASPDGNTVNIEDQALRAVESQSQHALAMTIYGKSMDLLRLSLGRGR